MSIPLSPLLTHSYLFGSILATTISIQIISGIILSFSYSPLSPYSSIITIITTTPYGYIYSYIHLSLSSIIFIITYIHISSSIYNNSYSNPITFSIGITTYIILIVLSFLGYTLPFGQISY
jgi:ubiquinol-cytochrome c reductase cytochrome b subunit